MEAAVAGSIGGERTAAATAANNVEDGVPATVVVGVAIVNARSHRDCLL